MDDSSRLETEVKKTGKVWLAGTCASAALPGTCGLSEPGQTRTPGVIWGATCRLAQLVDAQLRRAWDDRQTSRPWVGTSSSTAATV